ncbi:unnamed protein product [Rhodiola kirilowii]
MVVGMRRTTRVFGVVKSGDGGRILRSGRKLWSEPDKGKLKKSNSARDEWLKILDEEDRSKVATGWCGQVSIRRADIQPEFRNETCDSVDGREKASEMKIVKVYERKRKRFDWDAKPDGSLGELGKGCSVGRMFGNHFVRRQRRRKALVGTGDIGNICMPGLVVKCTGDSSAGWLARFLTSILAYLVKDGIKLSKLYRFLSSDPIGSIFVSHGIQFLQECFGSSSSGYCKIFGVTQFAPLFSVNFSAVPACFMYIHSSMLLQSEKLVVTYLVNVSRKCNDEAPDESDEIIFCIKSGDHISKSNARSPVVKNSHKRNIVYRTPQGRRVACHQMQLRNSFSFSSIKGKRSAPMFRRRKCVSVGGGIQKYQSCVSATGLQKTELFEELKTSPLGWRSSDLLSLHVSNKLARRAGSNECVQNIEEAKVSSLTREATDLTSCAANILVIEHDKCYRITGASVMLELSLSNRWLIVVKKDGFIKYSHMAEVVMKPCTFNRATRDIIWTVNNCWKLEFPTREDWSVFKDLYKVCSSKNLETPTDKFIPVPGVHIVSGYEDTVTAPYSRPDAYINLDGSEVSRVLAKISASYDIDSEDEEWLAKYNEEKHLRNESFQHTSFDTFELMIDAIEKAIYFNSGGCLDERSIADVFPELGHEGFNEVVYNYWSKKRKRKSPTLARVLQAHEPRQVLNIGGPVMRKKRSFKRHSSQNGRGKQRPILEGEQLAILEVEEAKDSATRYLEWATHLRKRAQALMENADLATYKAAFALKIAQAAKDASVPGIAASMILI